jgi:DNA-binding response OmpR family regulator
VNFKVRDHHEDWAMKKLTLNTDECRAYWGGHDLKATTGEFRILAKLASKPGSYFSYRDIYDNLRGTLGFHAGEGENGINGNVRSAIKRIRRKFIGIDTTLSMDDVITNFVAFGYGLKRDVVDAPRCCPSCGQVVIVMRETVVVAQPAPLPVPQPEPVPDYQRETVC